MPLFLMMVVGYIIRLTGVMNDTTAWQTNKAIFTVFLSMLVFENIYKTEVQASLNSWLLIYVVAAVMLQFSVSLCIVILTEHDNSKRGVMLQGMFRGNFVLYGIPVCTALFGSDAAGSVAVLVAIIVPMYNVLSVIALEIFNGGRPNLLKTLLGIITNPIILATVAAILCNTLNINLPGAVTTTVSNLASIATPLAFVILGSSFAFKEIAACVKDLCVTLVIKLLFFPALLLGLAVLLGFRDSSLAAVLVIFTSPIAVSSFCMAQHMGGDDRLADHLVVFSSLFSIGTMCLFIFALRWFGFM